MAPENRSVIVTGGGGAGCGRSISVRFASRGASVVVSDIDDAAGYVMGDNRNAPSTTVKIPHE